jgi:hypothetical protein
MFFSLLFSQGAMLCGSLLAAFARTESSARAKRRKSPPSSRPPRGTLAGIPLEILLSDRSGPGAMLRDTLLHRPSERRGF